MNSFHRRPPAGMVAAAEQEYHAARDALADLTDAARTLMAHGDSELEATINVYSTLRSQQHKPIVLLIAAAAIVRLATSAQPEAVPRPAEPGAETE